MRKVLLTGLIALFALPSLASAATTGADRANAARDCNALRTSLGAQKFKDTYGTNAAKTNAYGRCVAQWTAEETENRQNAAKACAAEREADEAAFATKYGTGANAFGKCVSSKRSAESRADRRETVNAARTCSAERKADPAAFRTKYGTNASKSNAFGKCVSAKAKTR